ncbi:MAG: FHA domain-containing protein [Archangiaceae bacterium]|nr:FHA domain-containing protein [Archangiaceae bacterium]
MSDAPWLEVLSAPEGLELQVGQRVRCAGLLGRRDCDITVTSMDTVGRRHCRFGVEKGRPFVEDLQSTHGTYVNGVSRHERVELSVGDCIEVPRGLVLRLTGAPPLAFDSKSQLVQQVLEAPHEETRWRVWADQLLERGDPLGERLARGRGADAADDAKALTTLARTFVDGGLEIEWRHGFIRRAVLRNRHQWPPGETWIFEWRQLLSHPLAYFIEEIELDVLSYTRGIDRADRADAEGRIVTSLEQLAGSPRLPLLKSVRFGPSPRALWNSQLEGAWARAVVQHPTLREGPIWVARAAWLQLLATPPGVTIAGLEVGAQRKLFEDQENLVGALPDCAFAISAPERSPSLSVALRLDREHGLWVAEDIAAGQRRDEQPLYVNGRRCTHHRMRPHDRLEPAPGLLFRFVME